jgi:hypothetical protein
LRSQSRSAVGWILAPALIAALLLPGTAVAATKTGQSPDCKRFCMSVEPREGPEGSVFRFTGRGWRPNRRVRITFGAYCRPGEACIAILYFVAVQTNAKGRYTFRLRAGAEQAGDRERGILSGERPNFRQRAGRPGHRRTVSRAPRYRVILPG